MSLFRAPKVPERLRLDGGRDPLALTKELMHNSLLNLAIEQHPVFWEAIRRKFYTLEMCNENGKYELHLTVDLPRALREACADFEKVIAPPEESKE